MALPNVQIIILNWNGIDDTRTCLHSLRKISYTNFNVLVVDNGSSLNESKKLKTEFPEIDVLRLKKNFGFALGNVLGIRKLRNKSYDYLLYLNNDTIVTKNFLEKLVHFSEKNHEVGIVGPAIYYARKQSHLWSAGGIIDFNNGIFRNIQKLKKTKPLEPYSVDYINGCCLLMKKSLVEDCGSFDSDYFAYVEDVDLNARVHKLGFTSACVPSSKIFHSVSSASGGEGNLFKERLMTRNILFFIRKNYKLPIRLKRIFQVYKYKLSQIAIYIRNGHLPGVQAIAMGLIQGHFQQLSNEVL